MQNFSEILLEIVYIRIMDVARRKEGYNGLFITLVPKFFNNVFFFVVLTTLGTFNEF